MGNQQTQQPKTSAGQAGIITATFTIICLTLLSCSPSRESSAAEIAAQLKFQDSLVTQQEAFQAKLMATQEEFQQKVGAVTKEAGQNSDSLLKVARKE